MHAASGPDQALGARVLRWLPPRAYAWALLALILLPAGLLTRNGAAYLVFPPLAVLGLLLPAPAGRPRFVVDRQLLWPLLAFYLWALVTLLWTPAPDFTLLRLPGSLALIVLTLLSYGAAKQAAPEERRLVGRALALGFVLGYALLASELLTGSAILFWRFPEEGYSAEGAKAQADAQLIMFAFASIALAGWLRGLWRLLPLLAVLPLAWLFGHWAGVLGMAAALTAWGLARRLPRFTLRAWPWVLVAVLLLWPFIGLVLQAASAPDAAWKPNELLQREQIWRFGAERALEKPLFGWGFSASRNFPNGGEVSLREGKFILSPHPHNVPLLLWFELGLPGVALAGWFLWRLSQRLRSPEAQAFLACALVLAMITAGLWPSTWLALSCCGILLLGLLVRPAPDSPAPAAERPG